jgi:anthranilate/para-aminobenzoate synthase component II
MREIKIAVGYAKGVSDIGSLLNYLVVKFPEIHFLHVNLENMDLAIKYKAGDFFSAWINPGSADSFSRNDEEFNLATWSNKSMGLELEYLYQKSLDFTSKYNIPYFGICGGAQHLALYHGASMKAVNGYDDAEHNIHYEDLSLSLFYTMSLEKQQDALYNCSFQDLNVQAITFNNYAVIAGKTGDLDLGATSDDIDVAMAYAHQNGIRYGTQYHLEELYEINEEQTYIIDSFIKQAYINFAGKNYNFFPAIDIYSQVSKRINECKVLPTSDVQMNEDACLNPNSLFAVTYESYFDFSFNS